MRTFPTVIAANIQIQMDALGINQAEVCRRTGMRKSHLSEIMRGHNTHPSVWTMARIASAFGCKVDDLICVGE
jgi:transcriptional regulator with XRE-family HTH domain